MNLNYSTKVVNLQTIIIFLKCKAGNRLTIYATHAATTLFRMTLIANLCRYKGCSRQNTIILTPGLAY